MGDSQDLENAAKKTAETTNGFIKGNKLYHETTGKNYKVQLDASTSTKVAVIDKTALSSKQLAKAARGLETGPPKGDCVFRLDKAHRGAEFNHVNINPSISKLPNDPHVPLPRGTLTVSFSYLIMTSNSLLCMNVPNIL